MIFKTFSEINTKVRNDTDNLDEDFITETEMIGYCNEAIDDCEALIHTKYEDYFLTRSFLSIVSGTSDYSLPSDIFCNKIRHIFFKNSGDRYEIKRIRNLLDTLYYDSSSSDQDSYKYLLLNPSAATSYQIRFYPTPSFTSSSIIEIWYLRNANRISSTTDTVDIPEFHNYIFQHMKVRCYEKEQHPNTLKAVQDEERQRMLMEATLSDRVADNDNLVIGDYSFYDDFDNQTDYHGDI